MKAEGIIVKKTRAGYHFIFKNGVTASVQASELHYCNMANGKPMNYEIACWLGNMDEWITKEYSDVGNYVIGYFPIVKIPAFLEWCKNYTYLIE
jgi:hypothetical protein